MLCTATEHELRKIPKVWLRVQSDALKPLAKEWITQIPMGRLAEVTDLEVRFCSY